MNISNWEKHEIDCFEYLKHNYEVENLIHFNLKGGSDSSISDIEVYVKNKLLYYIEAKMPNAQCGQFVLFADYEKKEFIFSSKNKTEFNKQTKAIISELNKSFNEYAKPSTDKLELDTQLFYDWIIEHYRSRNVRFIISKDRGYTIFPLEKIDKYFNVTALYRVKKSGSANPPKKDYDFINDVLSKSGLTFSNLHFENKYMYVEISGGKDIFTLHEENNTYYFKRNSDNNYIVKKLSKTYNPNIIFSISLKSVQDPNDLVLFKNSLK